MTSRHPLRDRTDEQGMILVMAVILVTLAIVIVSDIRTVTRVEWEAASNADIDFILDQALSAGYQVAEAHLRQDYEDSPDVDHLLEEWATSDGIDVTLDPSEYGELGYQQDSGNSNRFSDDPTESAFPKVRIFIEDEDRKYPLPLLLIGADTLQDRRKRSFANLIHDYRRGTPYEVGLGVASGYADAIVDFIKRKENESIGPIPRPATKSGTLISPTDLALIPGIPDVVMFDQVDTQEDTIFPGLIRYITCWSDLAVNINTAPIPVLRALPRPEYESVGFDIATKRGENQEEFMREEQDRISRYGEDPRRPGFALPPEGDDPMSSDPGTENEDGQVGFWDDVNAMKDDIPTVTDNVLNDFVQNATVTSRTFSIYIEASMRGQRRIRQTIVRREGARFVPILSHLVSWPRFRHPTEDELQADRELFR